jgi:hypothetical protein
MLRQTVSQLFPLQRPGDCPPQAGRSPRWPVVDRWGVVAKPLVRWRGLIPHRPARAAPRGGRVRAEIGESIRPSGHPEDERTVENGNVRQPESRDLRWRTTVVQVR